ncbi:hypothetical protein [Psychromonas aquimarina]|uniref:hypothetical protein n=1 Tax=Psychromonas aquimarina TaxID=444919 RepID=UPI0003FDC587|nr:hypothetical protein [Psychromonas aquimarina]
MINKPLLSAVLFILLNSACAQQPSAPAAGDEQAYEIGIMVQEIQTALTDPEHAQSLQTIISYGTDSRYYVMIRGWLFQELVGVESQLHASRSKKSSAEFQLRSDFLKQAIRAIDLE